MAETNGHRLAAPETLTIGILQADSVLEQFQDRFGNYPGMFHRVFSGAAKRPVTFRNYNVEASEYPVDLHECDAYVITGSRRSVYEDEHWIKALEDFVRRLHEHRKKTIGICFGHQMIAQALGGRTESASPGWGVGVHRVSVLACFDFMDPPVEAFNLLVSHKDQVTRLPDGAVLIAGSDFCPNAAFRIEDHILTFQGHPEFVKAYSRALMEMRQDILGEGKYRRGMASLDRGTHEHVVAGWILNFIET